MDTESQHHLLESIYQIFPDFEVEWAEHNSEPEFRTYSLHSVYMAFLPWVAGNAMTEAQLGRLADFLSNEVSKGGDPANAVDTCFLEHAHQVGIANRLRPILSDQAKAMLYA